MDKGEGGRESKKICGRSLWMVLNLCHEYFLVIMRCSGLLSCFKASPCFLRYFLCLCSFYVMEKSLLVARRVALRSIGKIDEELFVFELNAVPEWQHATNMPRESGTII